ELLSILLRKLPEGFRLLHARGHQSLSPLVHLLSLSHGSLLRGGWLLRRTQARLTCCLRTPCDHRPERAAEYSCRPRVLADAHGGDARFCLSREVCVELDPQPVAAMAFGGDCCRS